MNVLTVNAGSTGLKLSLHDLASAAGAHTGEAPPPPLWQAHVQWAPPPHESVVEITTRAAAVGTEFRTTTTRQVLQSPFSNIDSVLATLWRESSSVIGSPDAIDLIAHRVVHGGPTLRATTWLTDEVRAAIARAGEDTPTHAAFELEGIDTTTRIFGTEIPHAIVFDTAFHATLQRPAYTYAGPHAWLALGLRRYGFHGISHQYAARRVAHLLGRTLTGLRVVTAHLGGGCSLAAVRDGISVDTTMGFTPIDGLPMATRSGAIDPGLLLHLLRHGTYTIDTLQNVLNQESGLKGLSGRSGDMRELLTAADTDDDRAQLAIDVYVHHLRQGIAAMAASMNGIDALVFTAGVGEHALRIRADVCAGLAFLGVTLDNAANWAVAPADRIISAPSSLVAVAVVRAEENWAIAQESVQLEQLRQT